MPRKKKKYRPVYKKGGSSRTKNGRSKFIKTIDNVIWLRPEKNFIQVINEENKYAGNWLLSSQKK